MTEDLGRILDTMAFHAMSTKDLVNSIADHVMKRHIFSLVTSRNLTDREATAKRIDELVEKHGSIGGSLTRKRLLSLVLKRVRNRQWKEYRSRVNGYQNP